MRTILKLIPLLTALVLSNSALADSFIYVVTGAAQFGTVDTSNGAFNAIGSGLPVPTDGLVAGPGGSLLTLGVDGSLYSINPATGASTLIGATGLGVNAFSLAELNGVLYVTDFSNNLYTLNPVTAAATPVGTHGGVTGIPPDHDTPFTIDPGNGYTYLCDESLAGFNGSLYATYDEFELSPDGSTINVLNPSDLWKIDPTTGVATEISSTAFMLDGSFDSSGSLYAFQAIAAAPYNGFNPLIVLETINTSNGNNTTVTDIDPSAGLIFGAAPDVPEPASIFLLGTGLAALATRVRSTCKRQR